MKKSMRLQPVVEVTQKKADDAARKVAECQKKVDEGKQQLEELVGYREDYSNGLQHKRRSGLNAARMNDYITFMDRLDFAIEQQQIALDCACRELSAGRRSWLEKQQRVRVLENVVLRHQQSEQQEQSRREQNESDEHSLRVVRTVAS